jgi:hypothetical protein
MGYDKPYHRVNGRIVAHELRSAYGAPVYGGTVPAEIFSRIFADYRDLQGPPTLIGAPSAPPIPTFTPSATPTATATVTGKPTPASPAATLSPVVTPSTSPTRRGLL